MEKREISVAVWHDDHIEEALERVRFALIELGIHMKISEAHRECTVYLLTHAERLNDGKKET